MIDRTAAITAFVFAALASGTLAADRENDQGEVSNGEVLWRSAGRQE
ncbi:MAG: hypothetical protein ABI196_15305 [Bradyrhizobium sp.]